MSAHRAPPPPSRRSQHTARVRTWACPHCGALAMPEDLQVDEWMTEVLRTVDAGVNAVDVTRGGDCTAASTRKRPRGEEEEGPGAAYDNPIFLDDD